MYSKVPNSRQNFFLLLSILALLCASVALNVALATKLRSLTTKLSTLESESRAEGTLVPDQVEVKNLDGEIVAIPFSKDRHTIVYVFSPSCAWCEKNLANFSTLYEKNKGKFDFLGISSSSKNIRTYADSHGLDFPVFTSPSLETIDALKLGGTPHTIVVSNERSILKSWKGAYLGSTKSEIEAYFDLELPGVSE
ncbi:MAG: TlpA family protein disulfide reductase [Acidobacteria bacterium]|nr:TlpA family protein disulfide reductase [Acidobacteriota bacterium]